MKAGRLDRRIRIERGAQVRGGLGSEPILTWTALIPALSAQIIYGTGQERREAATEASSQAASFRVRSYPATRGVKVTDRIVFDDRNWDIASITVLGRNDGIEFVATAAVEG